MKDFGILVPIVTPCTTAGEVDFEGVKNVCRSMINAGCQGIFLLGSTGRGPWFPRRDRIKICEVVSEVCNQNTPVFAGCMATGLDEMIDNAHIMSDAGAQIVVITAPGYFNYNQAEVEKIFLNFADRSPLPVLIYDIPGFAGIKLDPALIQNLSHHSNVIGLKDSSSDMTLFRKLITNLSDLETFYLFQGKEHLLADSLLEGASGFVVSLLHFDPTPFMMLYGSVRARDIPTAKKIQEKITEIYKIVESCLQKRPETSTLFHMLNYTLKKREICHNITLKHEGSCPEWIVGKVEQILNICQSVREITTNINDLT